MQKRGQITIFIIIGVILLFSTALVLYIKSQVTVPVREVRVSVEKVPTEIQPLQIYVSECIEKIATDAVLKLGMKGGYIATSPDDPDIDVAGKTFSVNAINPTEADAVPFPPGANNYVVYWHYMKSPNDCSECMFASLRPPLYRDQGTSSIEAQIDRYVNKHLKDCTANFEPFVKEGFEIKELGEIKTTSYVTERDLQLQVEWPIEARKGTEKWQLTKFGSSVDVNLKKIYDVATYIVTKENEGVFLEVTTLNLISGFSSVGFGNIDSNKLPPMAGLDFGYKTVTWSRTAVKEKMEQMLSSYVPSLQIANTTNFFDPILFRGPITRGLFEGMVLPGKIDEVGKTAVNFLYLGWPIYLSFGGGEILTSQTMENPLLEIFPLRDYSFVYDVSYPVVVRIEDASAFVNKGYTFFFALESNIRNNEPVNQTRRYFEPERISGDVSRFCDPKQRNSAPVAIITYDKSNNQPLADVVVSFTSSQKCSIGTTELDNSETSRYFGKAVLYSPFPIGIGRISLSKQGYMTLTDVLGTSADVSIDKEYYLYPIKEMKAEFVRVNVPKIKEIYGMPIYGTPVQAPLREEEVALVLLERKEATLNENSISALVISNKTTTGVLRLAPGEYNVRIQLMYNSTVILPEDEQCHPKPGIAGFFGAEDCVKIPEIKFDIYPENSIEFNWTVPEEIYNKNTVEFKIFTTNIPATQKDYRDAMDTLNKYNTGDLRMIMPTLK